MLWDPSASGVGGRGPHGPSSCTADPNQQAGPPRKAHQLPRGLRRGLVDSPSVRFYIKCMLRGRLRVAWGRGLALCFCRTKEAAS